MTMGRFAGNVFLYWILPVVLTMAMAGAFIQFVLGYNVLATVEQKVLHWSGPPSASSAPRGPSAAALAPGRANEEAAALRRQLADEKARLSAAERQVQSLRASLASRTAGLKAAQAKLSTLEHTRATAAQQAGVYANMSAQQAALIILKLPFQAQVDVLKAMDPATQASVLTAMPPATAAKLLQAGA